jgi:pimeloyl-ACP methyl ester carboxylesterase
LATEGFITINIDFEYNGIISENPVEFDSDRFSMNTVSREFENASSILELLNSLHNAEKNNLIFNNYSSYSVELKELQEFKTDILQRWNGEINLVGHSRGGGIALLAANRYNFVKKIALLAPIGYFDRYTDRLKAKWRNDKWLEFNDIMSKQQLRINASYIDDLDENKSEYDLLKIAENLSNPILIIHGENDLSVPVSESKELYNSFKKIEQNIRTNRNFVLLKKANHLFNINHPFEKSNSYLDEVCDLLNNFLKEK